MSALCIRKRTIRGKTWLTIFKHVSLRAGRSSFGISELKELAELSHKFELRYPTGLLGGTPAEVPEVYRSRSPLYKADRIKAPVRLFQGSLDKVVPKEQSEAIRDAILKNGGRVEYTLFEGEGHGERPDEGRSIDALTGKTKHCTRHVSTRQASDERRTRKQVSLRPTRPYVFSQSVAMTDA